MTLAADRNDHRGGRDFDHRVVVRGRDRGGFNLGLGFYAAPVPVPAPAAAGYYDQFGVWHPYGFYDQFGVWHSY